MKSHWSKAFCRADKSNHASENIYVLTGLYSCIPIFRDFSLWFKIKRQLHIYYLMSTFVRKNIYKASCKLTLSCHQCVEFQFLTTS